LKRAAPAKEDEVPEAIVLSAGRSGQPRKAVALSSPNLLFAAHSLIAAFNLSEADLFYSHLSPSRLAEQILSIHCAVLVGAQVAFAPAGGPPQEGLKAMRPTVLFGPPDYWREIQAELLRAQRTAGIAQGRLARAVALAQKRHQAQWKGLRFGVLDELEYRGHVESTLLPLKRRLGLDRVRVALSSGSALPQSILDFFTGVDLPIQEVYGQAEVSGLSAFNLPLPGESRAGSVGRPVWGVEVRISSEREILLRHPQRAADGWLATGDLGRLDDDGFLFIEGRKGNRLADAQRSSREGHGPDRRARRGTPL
jgi:long-chain acyl-CoA synthetase